VEVGLVGWATRTGIGYIDADLWELRVADRWLVPEHPLLGVEPSLVETDAARIRRCRVQDDVDAYRAFLDGLSAVVFVERPFLRGWDLVAEARAAGVITCCMPMMEALPPPWAAPWVREVDVMWATTRWCARRLRDLAVRAEARGYSCRWRDAILPAHWGVNLARFPFRERARCDAFVFCNGYGGRDQRKGSAVVAEAARLAPDVRILFRSQRAGLPRLPPNVTVLETETDERAALYAEGGILVAPSRWEGLGLQLYEAQASGMPLITSDAHPMVEAMPMAVIAGRTVVSDPDAEAVFDADPADLARLMRRYAGGDLRAASRAARATVEEAFDLGRNLASVRPYLARACAAQWGHRSPRLFNPRGRGR